MISNKREHAFGVTRTRSAFRHRSTPGRSALCVAAALTLVGCVPDPTASDGDAAATSEAVRASEAAGGMFQQRVCGAAQKGQMRCHALVRAAADGSLRPAGVALGYGPADLQSAYQLPDGGAGATIAIVDAFDDPTAESDLATYRANYGLPACTTANGCFRKVNQAGAASPLPRRDLNWELEISLDLDAASAVCPRCRLLLVEANSNSFSDLAAAVNTAARLGATVISNSYGGAEFSGETSFDGSFNHPGIAVFVSTGDSGFGVEYPAASPFVTAVGGTSLLRSAGAPRGWTETAWNGAGSGCSAFEPKPSWQRDSGCPRRSLADVSAVADPATGLGVFDSGNGGWLLVGGTSLATPVVAGIYALAAHGAEAGSYSYADPGAFFDVVSGSNGSCGSYLCNAGGGYDGPTGNGTPHASVLAARKAPLDAPSVFDAEYYLSHYPDLRAAFGTNTAAARNHWLSTGIDEGRSAARTYDGPFYLGHYPDLRNAFGTNYRAALTHFLTQGLPVEGRRGSREFDVAFYRTSNGDLQNAFHTDFAAVLNHWVIQGLPVEGRRGSREFDVRYYLGRYGDLAAAFGSNYRAAIDHWINQGLLNEGRRGSREFDVRYYLGRYSDLAAAFGSNFPAAVDHWINQGLPVEGRRGSRELDVQFYLTRYGDLAAAFGSNFPAAVDHWIAQGLPVEGRRGAREFDVRYYLGRYGDLAAAFGSNFPAALDHWSIQGLPIEGRAGANEVDVGYYLGNYADLRAAFGTNFTAAIDHWIVQGLPNEGRRAALAFDVQFYLATYADLRAAFGTNFTAAIDHWIVNGIAEGRKGAP